MLDSPERRQLDQLVKNGAPGEIRTPDRPVRSRVLYPAELRARCGPAYCYPSEVTRTDFGGIHASASMASITNSLTIHGSALAG